MIKSILLSILVSISLQISSQNLVTNGDIEIYSSCPTFPDQVDHVNGWDSPTTASPDFFHSCAVGQMDVPNNFSGSQSAHSGSGYLGLLIDASHNRPNYKEYIQTSLTTPLSIGVSYDVNMFLSLGDEHKYGSDAISALFSTTPVSRNDSLRFTQIPQASNQAGNYILDKNDWKLVTMTFIADSAYNYMTIGNFLSDSNTTVIFAGAGTWYYAYFYIDDISITPTASAEDIRINGDSIICLGETITLTASGGTVFSWANGSAPNTIISSDTSITISPDTSSTYYVYGPRDTSYFRVTVLEYPVVDLGNDTTLCFGDTLGFNLTDTLTYLWSNGSTSETFTIDEAGTYEVQISNGDCSITDSIQITYYDEIELDLGHDTTLCEGETITLSSPIIQGSYLWSTGATNSSIIVSNQGMYWVEVTLNNCSNTDTLSVLYHHLPEVNLGNDTLLCKGILLNLDVTQNDSSVYLWSTGATDPSIIVDKQGEYWVEVTTDNCSSVDTLLISYHKLPEVNLGSDTILCKDIILNLNITQNDSADYLWSTGATDHYLSISQEGLYTLQVTQNGCSTTDSILVLYYNCGITMPNVFSPNSDGDNEYYYPILSEGIETFDISIYNRWGNILFKNNELLIGWDGTYGDKECPAGTYFWTLYYVDIMGNSNQRSGFLQLFR